MKNYLFLLVFGLWSHCNGWSQKTGLASQKEGHNQVVAAGIYLPLGVFADSHIAGIGVDYSRSKHRFGKDILPVKKIGWVLNGGASYFLGKTISAAGHDFRYGGYLNLYATAGAIYNPIKNGNMILTAGPAVNLYKQSVNAGIGVNFLSHYFISEKIAIGSGVSYKKHSNTDALFAIMLRASYIF